MIEHARRFAVLVSAGLTTWAGAQERLLFTHYRFNDPQLQSMNLDGSDVQDVFEPANPFPTSDWLPVGLSLDGTTGRIYWTHGSTPGVIRSAYLDGSTQSLLVSGLKIPRGVAVDYVGAKMYWTQAPPEGNAAGLVKRADLDGSNVETVYAVTPYDPVLSKVGRPTVDVVNGYVYFGSNGEIKRVHLDGPPFVVETVASGGSTITRVQVDVANHHLYWIDSDTISDCIARVNLDNSGFTVVLDSTPDEFGSSGLIDLVVDAAGGKAYWADEIGNKGVFRGDLHGENVELLYASPPNYNASALAFDENVEQPILDCNDNGVVDREDVQNETSDDCNANGIPDECETDPCAPPDDLLDQGLDVDAPARALGGTTQGTGWMVFQPFDVPAGGWSTGRVSLNGRTNNYNPQGFTATLLPDDGANEPDEDSPIASADYVFRFGPSWESRTINASLSEGRYWLRLAANDTYTAGVYVGTSGLASFSRSNLGNDFPNQPPIALRIEPGAAGDGDGDGDVDLMDVEQFLACFSGHGGGVAGGCEAFDIDLDGDVDRADFALLQIAFTGGL